MTTYNSIICLHGFLGRPDDWNFLTTHHTALDLFSPKFRYPLNKIGEVLCKEIRQYPAPRLVMGYSMGGRLLLHALETDPSLAAQAILVSTHFGLSEEPKKKKRLSDDQVWANRFLNDEWNQLINDWNEQNVFGKNVLCRNEKDFTREALSFALDAWSLGNQRCITVECPTLLVVGENDEKFLTHNINIVKSLPNAELRVIPDTGHRVIFESPSSFDSITSCGIQ